MQPLCPHCHNPIEVVALDLAHEILCPSCGSTFRLDMGSTVTWSPSEGPGTLGPCELVGMVGTGELGSVYKTHDPELDRTVAIEMPHAGILVSDEHRKAVPPRGPQRGATGLFLDRGGARGGRTRRHPLPRLRFRRGRDLLRLALCPAADFPRGRSAGGWVGPPTRWSTSMSTASSIARSSRRTSCSTSRASRNNRNSEMGRNQGTLRLRLRRCDQIPKSLMLTLHCLDPPR